MSHRGSAASQRVAGPRALRGIRTVGGGGWGGGDKLIRVCLVKE